jgi:hypothetical protein
LPAPDTSAILPSNAWPWEVKLEGELSHEKGIRH